ncbi:dicarboxylate/amino acid:cation symporter [Clostridium porci]|uniref:dicarboxylate/amino acid:cation symporter n=1 Tax=Clostridium porci TaxID=2605778 RepID=UPI003A91F636
MKKIAGSLPFKLLLGVILGILIGQAANEGFMHVIVTIKYILNQIIIFCVPLIIIGFIAPSITRLGSNASKLLGVAVTIAYLSSIGAALFSMTAGYVIIPYLSIASKADGLKTLPDIVFQLDIPQIMPVMSALVFSLLLGLAATWTKAKVITGVLEEFQQSVLSIVTKIVIPILPIFIAFTFCALSYEGTITKQLPVFLKVVVIVMVGHFIWMALLYTIGGVYSGKNPVEVIKNYGPAYITAVGTMSSAATLAVALRCAKKSQPPLRDDMVDFGIPLFANIHLCGSVLTEVFFVMTVSKILYGSIPSIGTMLLFCALLGVFAIGAPGVPGGTVMASLGLITGILGFDETGTALMLTIFALQDSFGTACNVTGDGALTMMLTGFVEKHGIRRQKSSDRRQPL